MVSGECWEHSQFTNHNSQFLNLSLIDPGPQAKETVSKVGLILIEACRSAQPCAHKSLFVNGFIGRTAVRPYATNLDQPTFETVSSVRPYATNLDQPFFETVSPARAYEAKEG